MHHQPAPSPLPAPSVEGIARVVRITGPLAWLEPEQTTSCGHCASSASCGMSERSEAGIGSIARRIEARQFALANPDGHAAFQVGERLVVGVRHTALLQAAVTAYGLPLLCALLGAAFVQGAYGSDALTLLGMLGSLAGGFAVARLAARRLSGRGALTPHYLRRARPDEHCGTHEERT